MTTTTALPTWLPEAAQLIATGAKKAEVATQFGTTRTSLRAMLKAAGLFQKPVADANRAARRAARKAAKAEAPAAPAAVAAPAEDAAALAQQRAAEIQHLGETLNSIELRTLARKHGITKTVDGKPIGSAGKVAIIAAMVAAIG
jgi:carboxylesterase type B